MGALAWSFAVLSLGQTCAPTLDHSPTCGLSALSCLTSLLSYHTSLHTSRPYHTHPIHTLTADYRSMVYTREASIAARKAAAVSKLRAGYGKEAAAREALQIKVSARCVGCWDEGCGEGEGVVGVWRLLTQTQRAGAWRNHPSMPCVHASACNITRVSCSCACACSCVHVFMCTVHCEAASPQACAAGCSHDGAAGSSCTWQDDRRQTRCVLYQHKRVRPGDEV